MDDKSNQTKAKYVKSNSDHLNKPILYSIKSTKALLQAK